MCIRGPEFFALRSLPARPRLGTAWFHPHRTRLGGAMLTSTDRVSSTAGRNGLSARLISSIQTYLGELTFSAPMVSSRRCWSRPPYQGYGPPR